MGHLHYRTPVQLASDPWSFWMEFRLNYHAHLFNRLQIDAFEVVKGRNIIGMVTSPVHIGRTEIPMTMIRQVINNFDEHEEAEGEESVSRDHLFCNWFEFRTIEESFLDLSELHVRRTSSAGETEDSSAGTLGGVQLEIQYKKPRKREEDTSSMASATERSSLDQVEQQAIQAQQPPAKLTGERMGMLKRLSGIVFNDAEYQSIRALLNLATALGQGIEVGNLALTIGYILLSHFYANQPMLFGNRLEMSRADFEKPRVLYRYTMATYGWKGLTFMGKGRRGILSESIRSGADLRSVLEYLHMAHTDILVFELGGSNSSSSLMTDDTEPDSAPKDKMVDENAPPNLLKRVFKPNFFVILDRRYEAVILSIRGTMSMGDLITDLACEYVPWRGGVVHSGLLMASQWFLDHIGRQLLLFAREYGMPNIYLVGHSLGGAIAALTTVMLLEWIKDTNASSRTFDFAETPKNIHCYAYGPPPIATLDLLDPYRDHIDTFVCGEDVVPHLSYDSIVNLKTLLVFAAEIGSTSHLLKDPTPELLARIQECRDAMIERNRRSQQCILHLPGRIHHLVKLRAPQRRKYTVIDETTSDRFIELRLRPKMMTHHFPWTYERALENAYATFLVQELEEDGASKQSPKTDNDSLSVGGDSDMRSTTSDTTTTSSTNTNKNTMLLDSDSST